MKKTIFVTGGTGLVGSHLLFRLVSSGENVKAAFRKNSNRAFTKKVFSYYSDMYEEMFNSIEWIECDICDYESIRKAMTDCSQVYHCAATVSFEPGEAASVIKNNVTGTANVVKSALESRIGKLCHVSSTAAIGASDNENMADETHGWNDSESHSAYSTSKYLSEAEVWKSIRNGLCAVIVNPSVILGPGDWNRGSSQYFSAISQGMLFYTKGVTGYVDVKDVCESMIMLMNSPVSGERFIVSSENLSFGEVFRMIAKSINARKPFIYITKPFSVPAVEIIRFSAWLTGKKSPVSKETIKSAYSKVTFDNGKIKRATGMTFKPIEKSIAETSALYLKENSVRR
jgi:dihydroflavonol-4-reductase